MKIENVDQSISSKVFNKIEEFCVFSDINKSITGVALQGGYARNTYTDASDIDLVFLFENEDKAKNVVYGFVDYKGYKFEVRHIYLNKINPLLWSDKQRYIYSNETQILYEEDNKFNSLINMAKMTKKEQIKSIVLMIRNLGKCGIVYKNNVGKTWRKFNFTDQTDYWVKKKDLFAAHIRLNDCNDRIIKLIFAINGQFMPSAKYRISILRNLKWLPEEIEEKLKKMYCYNNFSVEVFKKRVDNYIYILNICVDKAISLKLLPENIKDYYSKEFNRHNDNNIF